MPLPIPRKYDPAKILIRAVEHRDARHVTVPGLGKSQLVGRKKCRRSPRYPPRALKRVSEIDDITKSSIDLSPSAAKGSILRVSARTRKVVPYDGSEIRSAD